MRFIIQPYLPTNTVICSFLLIIGYAMYSGNTYAQDSYDISGQGTFELTGAWEGKRTGKATVSCFAASRIYLMDIIIEDIAEAPDYILKIRVESENPLELPAPGQYKLVNRSDMKRGYEGGMAITYTQILDYVGPSYYSNVALEYTVPDAWKATPKGFVHITAVDDTYVTGEFEFELWEDASINNAPRTGKRVTASNGVFKARIVEKAD